MRLRNTLKKTQHNYLAEEEEPYNDPAHWHEDDYDEAAYVADEDDPDADWYDFSAYMADAWHQKWSVDEFYDSAELDCVACLFDTLGPDCLADPDTCAEFMQEGMTAYLAKGKGKKGKGKGNGEYPVRPSNLTIEGRRN